MNNVISLVLGGGRGTRLYPLTRFRAKPAVPLAGKYRLIDIPLSNCIHSGLNRIYVLTQFLSVSLHRHIRQTYRFDAFSGGFVELLAAQQTMDSGVDWYQGTADAVRKNRRYLDQPDVDLVLILSGDQLYRMDFREMVRTHKDSGAEVTIAALPVRREAASGLGVMRMDANGRVVGFLEKPQTDAEIDLVRTDPQSIAARGIEPGHRDCLASMGIYLFCREFLLDVLDKTDYQDFGKEVFPAAVRARHVQAHLFDDYWEDIGTIRAFYDANLNMVQEAPPFEMGWAKSPVYSRPRFLPPTRIGGAHIHRSLIADGCRIGAGVKIENSIIGLRCQIDEGAVVRNSIVMGSDDYSTDIPECAGEIGIGAGAVIEGAILDKNCQIGAQARVVNDTGVEHHDGEGCLIRERIPIVLKDAVIPSGWKMA
ncbi:MAG: glucose-1-phosphate adenylyltransferase [Planctomycetaceae bacterium]|nr:glucose-1-phosphate adenylyltransferase [Planctomycetaceae bacterium]